MTTSAPSLVGIGFGPANLSLAVTLRDRGYSGRMRFLERADGFQWQRELLLTGTDIQNSPFRDLAMVEDPTSPHTFVNYLASQGRLLEYLHLANKFPLRREYAGYLEWVAQSFSGLVDYSSPVSAIELRERNGYEQWRVHRDSGAPVDGDVLVIGTGRTPRVPAVFRRHLGARVFHSSRYLSTMNAIDGEDLRVAVVGASQSAIEIILGLLDDPRVRSVTSIQRGIGFRLKDTSPFSRRVFLPEFVDYFYPLPPETKRRLRAELRSINYAACDADVIHTLATKQYEYGLMGSDRFSLCNHSEVTAVEPGGEHDGVTMTLTDVNHRTVSSAEADVVILATGFRDYGTGPDDERCHPLLRDVVHRISRTEEGLPNVARDYSVPVLPRDRLRPPALFMNGLCEPSHGMGDAGALAMLSTRSIDIADGLAQTSVTSDHVEEPGILTLSRSS